MQLIHTVCCTRSRNYNVPCTLTFGLPPGTSITRHPNRLLMYGMMTLEEWQGSLQDEIEMEQKVAGIRMETVAELALIKVELALIKLEQAMPCLFHCEIFSSAPPARHASLLWQSRQCQTDFVYTSYQESYDGWSAGNAHQPCSMAFLTRKCN